MRSGYQEQPKQIKPIPQPQAAMQASLDAM